MRCAVTSSGTSDSAMWLVTRVVHMPEGQEGSPGGSTLISQK